MSPSHLNSMLGFITTKFTYLIRNPNPNPNHNTPLRLLQTLPLNPNSNSTIQHNPTVSYLVNKCGLSLDSAISASNKVTITNTRKSDSVLKLFKSHHFTQPQIATAVTNCPEVLITNVSKNLKPKFEYFVSLGLSKQDLLNILFANNIFLHYTLTNTIVPSVDFLKTILHSNENVVNTLRNWSYIVVSNFRIQLEPNVSTLRARGVPESNISKLLMSSPRTFLVKNEVFRERVGRVEEMGFGPHSLAYIRAVRAMVATRQALWEKKVDVFKSFGWSDDDIVVAFKKQSMFMTCSEKKIRMCMDFYLNKLGLEVSDVVFAPNLLLLSLEKRVVLRCSVLHVLLSKGIVSNLNIVAALIMTKGAFDRAYVTKHLENIPEIASAYRGEKGLSEVETTQLAAMIRASNKSISERIAEKTVSGNKDGMAFQKC